METRLQEHFTRPGEVEGVEVGDSAGGGPGGRVEIFFKNIRRGLPRVPGEVAGGEGIDVVTHDRVKPLVVVVVLFR